MLYLIPAPIHRRLMPLANGIRSLWHRIARPTIHGVSIIARDEEDRVLLVRLSYGTPKWSMPAGGLKRDEDPEAAIRREVLEELGCELAELVLLAQGDEQFHGVRNSVWIFAGRVVGEVRPDMREVLAARFFAPDDLPERLEKRVRPRLDLLDPGSTSSAHRGRPVKPAG